MNPLLTGINPITQIMQNNPNMQKVKEYINNNGGDPEKAFYQMAKDMGVNPDEILSQVNNFAKLK